MTGKNKEGHVTFSGGNVTLYEPPSPRPNGKTDTMKSSEDLVDNEGEDRGAWGGKIEFMLTMVSYAVGLGENDSRQSEHCPHSAAGDIVVYEASSDRNTWQPVDYKFHKFQILTNIQRCFPTFDEIFSLVAGKEKLFTPNGGGEAC